MGLLISVWGKNGSGKSTTASNLACAYAKRGYKTALVGANRFYGSIQYFFNIVIRADQSLRAVLTGGDRLAIQDCFCACAANKNLFIASLSDGDDCAGYGKYRNDAVVRFINLVKKSFDICVFDCDESTEDPLSMYSLTLSDKILYVTRPAVQHAVFARAYEPIVAGLQIIDRIVVAFIGGGSYDDFAPYLPFGYNRRYYTLPLCKSIERAQGDAALIILSRGVERAAARYRRVVFGLADEYKPKKDVENEIVETDIIETDSMEDGEGVNKNRNGNDNRNCKTVETSEMKPDNSAVGGGGSDGA